MGPIFGMNLQEICDNPRLCANGIPKFYSKFLAHLEANGTSLPPLFSSSFSIPPAPSVFLSSPPLTSTYFLPPFLLFFFLAMNETGIFRISGAFSHVKEIKKQVDEGMRGEERRREEEKRGEERRGDR